MRAPILTAGVLAAAVVVGGAQGRAGGEPPLTIGLLRHDGILTPVAFFEKGAWVDAWPKPTHRPPGTERLETEQSAWLDRGLSVPRRWFVENGTQPIELHVFTKVMHEEYCEHQIGLLTDRQRLTADGLERRLVFSQRLVVDMPTDITDATRAREMVSPLIERVGETVRAQEQKAVREWERDDRRSADLPPEAARGPIEIKKLYVSADDKSRVIYYEAFRRYREPREPRPTALVAAGFLKSDGNHAPHALSYRAFLAEPEFEGTASIRPLAALSIEGRGYWIVRDMLYEGEGISIIETSPALRVVFKKHIGGC